MLKKIFQFIALIPMLFGVGACNNAETFSPETIQLKNNWKIFPSSEANATGKKISTSDFDAKKGHNASVPGTVMANLVRNGNYPDLYHGMNLKKVDATQFRQPWWYRTSFKIEEQTNANYELVFEGLNYKANIWLNGKQIANESVLENPFRMFSFDVSKALRKGENILAVEIIPPKFGDLSIGFVDWNPAAPDENMGLWRPVKLVKKGAVSAKHVFVSSDLEVENLSEAKLSVSAELKNNTDAAQKAFVKVKIGDIAFEKNFDLQSKQELTVTFDANEFPQLNIQQPKLWWPNGLGEANLHTLQLEVLVEDQLCDKKTERFGIRKIEQYLNAEGHKGWKVNGQEILIKGAGWVDDVLLDDSDEKVTAQLDYVKQMNMNTVRLEGFWGKNKTLYDRADENGLLIMIGWSCHWEWEGYCGRKEDNYLAIRSDEEMQLHTQSYVDQVKWLRNHPSVFLWVFGSDKLPLPKLERMLNKQILTADPTRPILSSCKWWDYGTDHFNTSEVSGPSAVKMLGPYSYVAPNYWYENEDAGGAFGFNTETGPGAQVPPLESLKRMLPKENYWPVDSMWEYHCGRNEFGTLKRYKPAMDNRYGESGSIEEFAQFAQVANYEAIRPMFEAFAVNRPKSTGVIQWMLNSAWPEMFWQLYDWYLVPNGAFYGTQNACLPLNAIYNYKDKNIYLSNEYATAQKDLALEIKILNPSSEVVFEKNENVEIEANSSAKVFEMPVLNVATTYFLAMKLTNSKGEMVADKLYWLSTQEDVHDFGKTTWVGTPLSAYGNLKGIRELPKVEVEAKHEIVTEGNDVVLNVELKNTSDKLAFFIEMRAENEKGELIVPVFWSDNYVSLLPNESKTYTARISKSLLNGKQPVFTFSGINTIMKNE